MAKYKESTITGESWVRANQIICTNPYNSIPTIQYIEEEIFNLSNGDTIKKAYTRDNLAQITEQFTQQNANEAFPLINPLTGAELGTTATYQDLYVILHSLYFYLATKVDRGPKPYPSWVWSDQAAAWVAPVPYPATGHDYNWDEVSQTWAIVKPPQPFVSWTWDDTTLSWIPPVPMPDDGKNYYWDETTQSWVENTLP